MGNNKETKKGFWANLFSSKPKCSCGGDIIVEDDDKPQTSCGCGSETSSCNTATAGGEAKEVIVLGPGCSKCKETYKIVERVIAENRLDVKLSKIEDIAEMMSYNIMTTPAVVVDGTVKIKGHVPTADEVKKALGI